MAKTVAEESTDDIERIEVPTGEADDVKIDLDPPDDDGGDDDERPVAAKGERERDQKTGRWTEKKRERAKDHKASKAWEQEKAAYDRRIADQQAAFDRRMAEMQATTARQIAEAVAARGGTSVPQDPHDAQLAEIQAALEAELVILGNQDTPNYKRYNELRRKEQEVIIAKALAARDKAQPQQRQQAQSKYAGREEFINNEFPWTQDPRCAPLNKKAWAYRTYLIETVGRPDTLDTDREALAHIQAEYGAEFGLRAPAKPRQQERDYFASRPAPGGAPERNGRPKSVILPGRLAHGHGLTDELLRQALASED